MAVMPIALSKWVWLSYSTLTVKPRGRAYTAGEVSGLGRLQAPIGESFYIAQNAMRWVMTASGDPPYAPAIFAQKR
jgi:hypothetical protein